MASSVVLTRSVVGEAVVAAGLTKLLNTSDSDGGALKPSLCECACDDIDASLFSVTVIMGNWVAVGDVLAASTCPVDTGTDGVGCKCSMSSFESIVARTSYSKGLEMSER